MNNPRTLLCTLTLAVSSALTIAVATAARAGVSTESPFAPRGLGVNAVASSPIELRGVTSDDKGMRFAIYNPANKEGAWVRIDEKGQPFVVRSYDEATSRVTVDYQGRTQMLTLAEPKFAPAKTTPMMIPGMTPQMIAVGQQIGSSRDMRHAQRDQQQQGQAQAQPSPAENARLEAIRAEIARRRSQRDSGGGQ